MTSDGDSGRYATIHEIVCGAFGLIGPELETYLQAACGQDTALRARVEAMLAVAGDDDTSSPLSETQLVEGRAAIDTILGTEPPAWFPKSIGEYTIQRQIGQGGMGVVYAATQQSPRRSVAIKLLHPVQSTPARLRRFRREAELLGRLQHPGIAQIYEASTYESEHGPQPFFAMELVEGVDIGTHCERAGLDRRARIELLIEVADAIQYAHERGVVHRDLKPDNVLVDGRGKPRVLDFGVARASDQATGVSTLLTEDGQLVGTLAYMAPEQLRDVGESLTAQSDVYSLGVLAFEMLTGQLPREVRGLSMPQAMARLEKVDATRASSCDPSLAGDLETILAKALESNLARRYASAAELADDLRLHLASEPILARPPSGVYRLRKFAQRNRTLVSGVVATVLVALAGAVIATGYAVEATQRATQLERQLYRSAIASAASASQLGDLEAAATHLDASPVAHRGWEYDYLRARLAPHLEWHTPSALLTTPAFDRSGHQMHAVLAEGGIGTWDTETGELLRTFELDNSRVALHTVKLHGPSGRFAARSLEGGLLVGDIASGEVQAVSVPLPIGDAAVGEDLGVDILAWDPTGKRLLFGTRRGGRPHAPYVGRVHVWNGTRTWVVADRPFTYGAFAPAGDRIALADIERIAMHDAESGECMARATIPDAAQAVSFSDDGATLAVAGHNRNVFLLDGITLSIRRNLQGHEGTVWQVLWMSDGRLVTTSQDQTVRIWDPRADYSSEVFLSGVGKANATPAQNDGPLTFVGAIPGRAELAVAGGGIRVLPTGDPGVLKGHTTFGYRLAFSPGGAMLASATFRGKESIVWDLAAARARWRFQPAGPDGWHDHEPGLAFSADGARVVIGTKGAAFAWDVAHGQPMGRGLTAGDGWSPFFEMLGRRQDDAVWRSDQALSPDGQMAAIPAIGKPGVVALYERIADAERKHWNPRDPAQFGTAPVALLRGHRGEVYSVAFSPDATRIATGGNDATVRIWDAETFEELLVLRGHEQYVKDVEWSPDGTMLASASGDTTIRLWDSLPRSERRARGRR